MTSTSSFIKSKPLRVLITTIIALVVVTVILGSGASFLLRAKPDELRSIVTQTSQLSQINAHRGGHATRDKHEKVSSLELLKWGGALLVCSAAFLGVAHRVHSIFGAKENTP